MTHVPAITPTPEQLAIIDAVPLPVSQMIEAMAGTAKTTTLRLAAQRVKKPALALAFNRSIAQELTDTFPRNFTCKSLNAWGFQALRRAFPKVKFMPDGQKLKKLIKSVTAGQQLGSEEWDQLRRLIAAAMSQGMTYEDEGSPLVEDCASIWCEMADQLWIHKDSQEALIDLARQCLRENLERVLIGDISFDDQIYAPLVLGLEFFRFPVIFGDEVQDWNALNHAMVERSLAKGGKLILAGDSRQSIYHFRGACTDSMRFARRLSPQWIDQTLTLTFRCPKAVVERQQAHAPGYRAAEGNPEGRLVQLGGNKEEFENPQLEGWTIDDLLAWSPQGPPAVLCRNNAPLLSLAFKLIRQRISVAMLGRDIGKGLVALSKKIARKDDTPAQEFRQRLQDWRDREIDTLTANDAEDSKFDAVNDRADCLLAVLDSAEVADAGALRKALDDLFSCDEGRIQLATIHRAKGLEWMTVMHLDPWRVPSKQARKKGGEALRQELNLRYVCETRARETLVLASLEDFA